MQLDPLEGIALITLAVIQGEVGEEGEDGTFTADTVIPLDANVVFEVRTADTQPELAAAPYTVLATATQANPIVTKAAPILLSSVFDGLDLRRYWLELQITVNPTADAQQTPTVDDWDLSFTCIDDD